MTNPKPELWTIGEVAAHHGVKPPSARGQLSRWSITAVPGKSHTGRTISLYPADQVRAAYAYRPGRGRHGGTRNTTGKFTARRPIEAERFYLALPPDTLPRLLNLELNGLPALPAGQWQALAHIIRGTVIDESWLEQPGELLAQEVEDAELDPSLNPAILADTCRTWTRIQAVAVIDTCQRGNLDILPTEEPR